MDIQLLAFVIGGYLSGSVLYAFLIPCLFTGIDIRAMSPDGNPGTANVFHVCGARIGILVAMMEFSKGFLPVAMALAVLDVDTLQYGFVPVILAPVLGHMCSVLNHFHGGIGIAPTICTKFRSPLMETVSGPTITYARFGNATIGARNASVKCEWFA